MDAQRFQTLVDAYGAEPRRWPARERAEAEVFARTAGGQAVLEAERALDDELDAWAAPAPSHALRSRVLAAAPQPRSSMSFAGRWTPLWAPGAGLVAAGLAGVLFGAVLSGPANTAGDTSAESLWAEAGAFDPATLMVDAL